MIFSSATFSPLGATASSPPFLAKEGLLCVKSSTNASNLSTYDKRRSRPFEFVFTKKARVSLESLHFHEKNFTLNCSSHKNQLKLSTAMMYYIFLLTLLALIHSSIRTSIYSCGLPDILLALRVSVH